MFSLSTPLICPAVPPVGWKVCRDYDGVSMEFKNKLETHADQAAYQSVVDAHAYMQQS